MKRATLLTPFLVMSLLFLSPVAVFSDGNIRLVDHSQLVDAWNASQIRFVVDWNSALQSHYPGMSGYFRIPNLAVMEEIPQVPDVPGVGMGWGDTYDGREDIIAAWQYAFGEDPDLTGGKIHFCVFAPCQISSISFGIEDTTGKFKSWAWTVGESGAVPCDAQACLLFSLDGGVGEGGATSFYEDSGFDIQTVLYLMFDANGQWEDTLDSDPFGFHQRVWTYWTNIYIEEATLIQPTTWGKIKSLF
ncbi:MAG: hypothetical protein AMJ46_10015 [Latescibacteria bacterium DG_63]|nr:MAG: hypothetical protein AMJ46_10015 [Latescibacteria bacterium DG_63]